MAVKPGSGGDSDFVTIFNTGSVDRDDYPELAPLEEIVDYLALGHIHKPSEGPDADAAAEFLATVRENHLVQSAGRYARNPDDPTNGATVFVRSAALPDQFTDLQVSGVDWTLTDTQNEIVDALRQHSSATAREPASETDVSKAHVYDTLKKLTETDDDRTTNDPVGDQYVGVDDSVTHRIEPVHSAVRPGR